LKASGFDEIWAVDLHVEQDKKLFPLPLESVFPCTIFRESLGTLGLNGACFVSSDQGDVRSGDEILKSGLLRKTSNRERKGALYTCERRAVIGDDILDTVATVVSACEKLVAAGAEELYICVTHELFTGKDIRSEIPGSPCSPSRPLFARYCCGPVATQRRLPRRSRFLP
jgi:ribose-phosphate pyrophosphokinase